MSTPPSNPKFDQERRLLIIFGVLVVLCILAYALIRRHSCLVHGIINLESPAQLDADDLADSLLSRKGSASLQDWSVQIMARYRAGQVATNRGSTNGFPLSIALTTNEVPNWLRGGWDWPPARVAVLLDSKSNEPECVVFSWYSGGVEVGPTNFLVDWMHTTQVKPGIYAYYNER